MIKILFMIHDLSVGGAEKVLVNLVNNMDKEKFDITVLSIFGGGVNEQFLKPHIKYRSIFEKIFPGNSKVMKLFSPKLLHKFFIHEIYDIEVSYLEGPSARIVSGCSNESTKLVSWIHVEQHSKKITSSSFRCYSESAKCYNKFNKIVCVSEFVKKDFLSLYPEINDVHVLYNTNETKQILNLKNEPVEDNVFNDGEIRLCGVGKIVRTKGFDKLARIHCRLRKEGYPVHTYILGVGDDRENIINYLKTKHENDSFSFLGYQTNPYKYVGRCDIFVCASSAEGFSTATTEALIVGTSVVTMPVSGMEEMLGKNGEYGIITEMSEESLYEGIKKLLDSPKLLVSYKKAARRRGEFFSTENTVRAVEHFFENVLNDKMEV